MSGTCSSLPDFEHFTKLLKDCTLIGSSLVTVNRQWASPSRNEFVEDLLSTNFCCHVWYRDYFHVLREVVCKQKNVSVTSISDRKWT